MAKTRKFLLLYYSINLSKRCLFLVGKDFGQNKRQVHNVADNVGSGGHWGQGVSRVNVVNGGVPSQSGSSLDVDVAVVDIQCFVDVSGAAFLHGFFKDAVHGLALNGAFAVVAVSHAIKKVIDSEELDNPVSVVLVGIGKEPHLLDLGAVDSFKHGAKFGVRL